MKTSELIQKIKEKNQPLIFTLSDGELIKGDLHITEIKNVHVDSTDCGGFKHSFQETVIQLWLDEESTKVENWTTGKASKILDTVGNQRDYLLDAEAFIEFGDSEHVTSKYGLELEEIDDQLFIRLNVLYPECKPRTLQLNACC